MKINPTTFGLACAFTVAALWSIYTVISLAVTTIALNISGEMAHMNFRDFEWSNFLSRFFVFLIVFSLGAWLTGWMIAGFYNYLTRRSGMKLSQLTRN